MLGKVIAVSKDSRHQFSKINHPQLKLLVGLGVEGDAHAGKTVQHRSRVAADPNQPNLRQVHFIAMELLEELHQNGFDVTAGQLGENITTQGLDLINLPKNCILHIGTDAVVQITGLRNPCSQLDLFQKGLLKAVLDYNEAGELVRKAGIMGIVLKGGLVKTDDLIRVEFPPEPFIKLERV